MTPPRRKISNKERAEIFRDNNGRCHICAGKIPHGEPWHVEHMKPRALNGPDDATNLRPAHIDCHAGKTRKERKVIAKADRALIANTPGLRKSKWPLRSRGFQKPKYQEGNPDGDS